MSTGAYYGEDPPVPIPNTEVKLTRADNTWRAAAWEDRLTPVPSMDGPSLLEDHPYIYSSLAQLVEHAAVNRRVVGSSPTGGAR